MNKDKKETLEEAIEFATKPFLNLKDKSVGLIDDKTIKEVIKISVEVGYKFGAKWKQEKSEQDMFNFARFCSDNHSLDDSDKDNICWEPIFKDGKHLTMKEMFEMFEQFKKK